MRTNDYFESIQVTGEELVGKVKHLIHEGNVQHIRIVHQSHTILEIPVTVGLIGVVLAPLLAAVAAVGAITADCTLEIIRTGPPE